MADKEKPKTKGSSLYDKSGDKMRGEEPKAVASADESVGTEVADTAAGDNTKLEKASDKFIDAMKKLNKLHDAERKDFITAHSDGLEAMAKRHQKAAADIMAMLDEPEPGAEGADMAPVDPAAAAPMEA